MNILYAHETLESVPSQSIFLAGPSPREKGHYNWRLEAIKFLEKIKFGGTVFIPLPRDGEWSHNYDGQVDWELEHLEASSIIVFWIPRDLKKLPAFTTNVEFGLYVKSGKVVLGFPKNAPKMHYLEYLGKKYSVPVYYTLEETLKSAVDALSTP